MFKTIISKRTLLFSGFSSMFATNVISPDFQSVKQGLNLSFFSTARYKSKGNAIAQAELLTEFGYNFIVDDGAGNLELRQRSIEGSVIVADTFSKHALTSDCGASLVHMQQPVKGATSRSLYDKLSEVISVKDFGAKGDNVTDDSAAFRNAISSARHAGKNLFVPSGNYIIRSPIFINYDKNVRGVRIFGENSGSYYSNDCHTTIRYVGEDTFCIEILGPIDGDGAPAFIQIDSLRFIGNNRAKGAIKVKRSWHVDFRDCSFINFNNLEGGAIMLVASGKSGFSGIVDVTKCTFSNCGSNIRLTGDTGGQINVVRVTRCTGLDQHHAINSDWDGRVPFTSNIILRDCHWEGSKGEVIFSCGVAGNWIVHNNYIEDSNTSTPIKFMGSGNYGICIKGTFFRKSALADGQALALITNGVNCRFDDNSSGFGNSDNIYSIDFVNCTCSYGAPAYGIGVNAYPVRMNNKIVKTGEVSSEWSRQMNKGEGLFCGISSGDGWPGGGSCSSKDEICIHNGSIRIVCNVIVTNKSKSGDSVLIGILPYRNGSCAVYFPVYTENVKGASPFHAVLGPNQNFAIVFDRNGLPLNYQTDIVRDSRFYFAFEYNSGE